MLYIFAIIDLKSCLRGGSGYISLVARQLCCTFLHVSTGHLHFFWLCVCWGLSYPTAPTETVRHVTRERCRAGGASLALYIRDTQVA